MTKVSIIVPFHNVENYISKCLSSLIHQTLEDIEIICVNDASDDFSKEKVLDYVQNDKRIILLNTPKVSGQSYCRNLGMEVASGEYIGFVDSDDWVELDMFEKMYNLAKANDTDITMCQASLFDDKEQTVHTDDYYSLKPLEKFGDRVFAPNETKDEILNINVVLWNKIYKKDFLKKINAKFENGYIYEDMLFFFETYLKAQKINILWENMYYYRQNRSFSTMQNSDKKVYDRIPMVEKTYNVLKQADFFEEKKTDIICWIIDDIFHRYTLLEDKYYEDYYNAMKGFFSRIELSEADMQKLQVSYCYDEFCNILERSYFGFWNFLIEKYKTSNKRIKAAEHKCNLDIIAIKDYLEEYKIQEKDEKEQIVEWWKKHCEEEKENLQADLKEQFAQEKKSLEEFLEEEKQKELKSQLNFLEDKKKRDMKEMYDEQQREFNEWNKEALAQQKQNITNEYEAKIKEQNEIHQKTLQQIKYYYENEFLLVKIILKLYKIKNQFTNKIKNFLKKN